MSQAVTPPDAPGTEAKSQVYHALSVEQVAKLLITPLEHGLSAQEAAQRLERHGPNALTQQAGRSAAAILIDQFKSLIIGLLAAATVIAFLMGEAIEGLAILVVIVLNASIGFFTEWQAERALAALQKQAVPTARVLRDGAEKQIPAMELVPGDIIVLEAGDRVPADGRILEAKRLQAEEASLTGESQPVFKQVEPVDEDAPLGDRKTMVFLGTAIAAGRGKALVTATGMNTEMGHIGKLIDEARSRQTPLEVKLSQLGRILVFLVLGLCAVIVLAGWLRGENFLYMLEIGISLAIAAVPEGLPAVATMTLALGMQRMARMNALVRRLPAVETLGSTTVICSDKTGTLTRNEMTARVFQLDNRRIDVTGVGYVTQGGFEVDGKPLQAKEDEIVLLALRIGALCNDARLEGQSGALRVHGDPTEVALLIAAAKAGLNHAELKTQCPRIAEVPFSSDTMRMITVHRTPDGKTVAFVKGAPGILLKESSARRGAGGIQPVGEEDRARILEQNNVLAGQALRVLALAYREVPHDHEASQLEKEHIFVGLVGMIDPLREEAKDAIARCREAGIRVIMLTGDQRATAHEIGCQLGLHIDPKGRELKTVQARDLTNMDEARWREVVAEAAVFARVTPEHKLRIVEALQAQGETVAMTGDGVNDAPALKKADIGIAMGIKGTEVAKEASAMVILDDNFATIVAAVEQGRIIYANILRFVHYLFSCNFAEILVVFVAIMLGWPLPLAALQVLWLNMITDVFPALSLALEPSSPDAMKRPPRDPKEPLLDLPFLGLIAWQGTLLAAVVLAVFALGMHWHGTEEEGLRRAVTLAFMTLALGQVAHVFNVRSRRRSLFDRLFRNGWLWAAVGVCVLLQMAVVYWPFLQEVLRTTALDAADWGVILAAVLAPLVVVEGVKFVAFRQER